MYKEGVNPFEIMINNKCQVITTDGKVLVGTSSISPQASYSV